MVSFDTSGCLEADTGGRIDASDVDLANVEAVIITLYQFHLCSRDVLILSDGLLSSP